MKFYIYHENSGITNKATAKTLTGAKREASAEMSFGGGSVHVQNENGVVLAFREFWQSGNSFGWHKWR